MAKAVVRGRFGEVASLDAAVMMVSGELVRVLDRLCEKRGVGREVVLMEALLKMEAEDGNGSR